MLRLKALFAGLLAWGALTGCQAPAAPAVVAFEHPAEARVELGGYRTQAVLARYTLSEVDHLRLRLLVKDAQGQYQPTGASRVIAKSALGSAVSLGNLKLALAYRLQAEAYMDAAETRLISHPAASLTDFAMPAPTLLDGVWTVDDAPVAIAVNVTLADRVYAGQASFTVNVGGNIRSKVDTLRLTLSQTTGSASAAVFVKTVPYAGNGSPSFTMTNLKADTRYSLLAEGLDGGRLLSVADRSTLTFSVPAPTQGRLDDDVNALVGQLTVRCRP